MNKNQDLKSVFDSLADWCKARDYAGFDPFDGLNSRVFQAAPLLKNSRAARLAWTQFFKRSPVNFRPLALVPKEKNAKGIALFALAHLSRYRATQRSEHKSEAESLLEELSKLNIFQNPKSKIQNPKSAWGYNFDWQGRAFFAPRGTPTIVPTAFAARAFVEASEIQLTGLSVYRDLSRSICDFILNDLNRTHETAEEICFSYSPLDATRVFNASLLAAETLALVGRATGEKHLLDAALRAARYVVNRQRADGSWAYGADSFQSWADNFHTAFVLRSLKKIVDCGGDASPPEFSASLEKGYRFWVANFFEADGLPKYFHDRALPVDCHSTGAAIVTLCDFAERGENAVALAEKIAAWTIANLRSRDGFFYYQQHRFYKVRIPYMRWTQSWMLYALARLIEAKQVQKK